MADIDESGAWAAVLARDRAADGRFVTGVLSTGIYCRPSCAARHPRRENVRFFADPAAACAAGLRACLRCRPDNAAADERAISRAVALIASADAPPSLAAMAAAGGYSMHHFHRLFRRATGITPAAYARGVRARRAEAALTAEPDVTTAVYAAGYAAPTRFYADADLRLGMTPGAWRRGGAGETIRWASVATELGPLFVAATERGPCRVAFGEDEAGLRTLFPQATIVRGDDRFAATVARAAAAVAAGGERPGIPVAVLRVAFEEKVRSELVRFRCDSAEARRTAA
ncbi:Ada metal-binding domain-containing protein [Sphingomonas sp. BIUV-7]|uniref:Ada metal-binding domain-containing protein n=1 Tax=Sphingomonas natans TaxID=3063330 RepID=A0ABT8Y6E9_9SPHN|nr:Ada metal-binding domain-containing protein [Sphingomonas sp. BIUV-7]MDO6413309.1 Ada metal-binding domain-containing protein [Sphingomonas sp. BIUV-7]